MKKVFNFIEYLIILLFLLIGNLFLFEWLCRLHYSYNSEGRYFDEKSGITYSADGLPAYGILSTIFLTIGSILSFYYLAKKWNRRIEKSSKKVLKKPS
ncbi:hypothetical protein [Xanthovirga aplysinae]|uniref:hypothetical protein n=1 Tax=Xanthovirga aplysinae TaxID=2529853 RepID=UPI0012BB9BC0|nr:hypothetical protein [Xanthovirga aplysinae]MTI32885.1 hypothetical protein [Xanthovirga aplysinae]